MNGTGMDVSTVPAAGSEAAVTTSSGSNSNNSAPQPTSPTVSTSADVASRPAPPLALRTDEHDNSNDMRQPLPPRLHPRPSHRVVIPPPNFGIVEDGLYRSGQPSELNFPFLEKLRLKAVVWLAPEDPGGRFLNFLDDQQISFHHLGVENAVNYDPITEEVVLSALDIIINPANSPLLVMCNLGRHRTGTVVGIFRKLQRWNLASILEEYRRYAGPKVRVLNEQFIELFDCDLVSVPLPP